MFKENVQQSTVVFKLKCIKDHIEGMPKFLCPSPSWAQGLWFRWCEKEPAHLHFKTQTGGADATTP